MINSNVPKKVSGKHFRVEAGDLKMDAMDATKRFVHSDITYYHQFARDFGQALNTDGPVTLVNQEKNWTIGVSYLESELGAVATAEGQVIERGDCSLSGVLEDLMAD